MVFNKKAISPVVATALLLVVAVVAVVGFQTWFNTYQSGLNVKVEQQSQSGSSLTVERLEVGANSEAQIYLKNNAVDNVTLSSWKVNLASTGAEVCAGESTAVSDAAGSTVTTYNGTAACATALVAGTSYNVVVVSSSGVFSATLLAR